MAFFFSTMEASFKVFKPSLLCMGKLVKIIFETLGLTEEEQLKVYRAVAGLVKNRLVKARSV